MPRPVRSVRVRFEAHLDRTHVVAILAQRVDETVLELRLSAVPQQRRIDQARNGDVSRSHLRGAGASRLSIAEATTMDAGFRDRGHSFDGAFVAVGLMVYFNPQ